MLHLQPVTVSTSYSSQHLSQDVPPVNGWAKWWQSRLSFSGSGPSQWLSKVVMRGLATAAQAGISLSGSTKSLPQYSARWLFLHDSASLLPHPPHRSSPQQTCLLSTATQCLPPEEANPGPRDIRWLQRKGWLFCFVSMGSVFLFFALIEQYHSRIWKVLYYPILREFIELE